MNDKAELHFILEKNNTTITYYSSNYIPNITDIIFLHPAHENDITIFKKYRIVNREWIFTNNGVKVNFYCQKGY